MLFRISKSPHSEFSLSPLKSSRSGQKTSQKLEIRVNKKKLPANFFQKNPQILKQPVQTPRFQVHQEINQSNPSLFKKSKFFANNSTNSYLKTKKKQNSQKSYLISKQTLPTSQTSPIVSEWKDFQIKNWTQKHYPNKCKQPMLKENKSNNHFQFVFDETFSKKDFKQRLGLRRKENQRSKTGRQMRITERAEAKTTQLTQRASKKHSRKRMTEADNFRGLLPQIS